MRHNLTNVLTNLVLEENGVVATIQGVVDANSDSPVQWSHCATIAKLISTVFCNENETNAKLLVPQVSSRSGCNFTIINFYEVTEFIYVQLLKILSNDQRIGYEYVFIQATASAVVQMLTSCSHLVEKYLFNEILGPLRAIARSTEGDISVSINQLYNLCVLPSNDSICVPIRVILPVSSILFSMHCQIKVCLGTLYFVNHSMYPV